MRIPISRVWVATLLAACAVPTEPPDPNGVSFTLNGTAHSTTQLTGGIEGSAFGISAADYTGFPELAFGVRRFTGTNVYPITPFDSTAAASCRTSTGRDPVTGLEATVTWCTITGTFAFSANSQAGDSVVVTNGHIRCIVPRLPAGAA